MGDIIYEPAGRAREYAELAANLYRGCVHKCSYCYVPGMLKLSSKAKKEFFTAAFPRKDILSRLEKDCQKMQGDPREILLCFTCDPYQPFSSLENYSLITREALLLFEKYNMKCTVLTKGAMRAERDFSILAKNGWRFGTTLTCSHYHLASQYEPYAATPEERIRAIKAAKAQGIKTWVSLEPVLDAREALKVINQCLPFVDFWFIGKWNHDKQANTIDYHHFVREAKRVLTQADAHYKFKKDLEVYL